MPALAVGILFAYFLYTRLPLITLCLIALIFYIVASLLGTYSFLGDMIPSWKVFHNFSITWLGGGRGGIFFGMPLVLLGGIAAKFNRENLIFWAIMSFFMMIFLLIEAMVLRRYVGGCGLDNALFMIPACFCITMFLRSISMAPSESMKAGLLWMRSMSILVFMSQRLFLTVIPCFFSNDIKIFIFSNPYFGAVILGGGTILFSALLIILSKKYNIIKQLY